MPSIQLQSTVYDLAQDLIIVIASLESYNNDIADLERLVAAVEGIQSDLKLCESQSILLLKAPFSGTVEGFKNTTVKGLTSGASGKVKSSEQTSALGFTVWQLFLSSVSGTFIDDKDNREIAQGGSNSGEVLYFGSSDPTEALKRAKAIIANKGTSLENQRAAIQVMQDKIIELSGETITSTFDTSSVTNLLNTVAASDRNAFNSKINTFITGGS